MTPDGASALWRNQMLLALLALLALGLAVSLWILTAQRKASSSLAGDLSSARSALDSAETQVGQLQEQKAALEKSISEQKEKIGKLEHRIEDLKTAMNTNSFDGRFPICSKCKDIRDEKGCWHTMEEFIAGLSDAEFSHSLCPDCARELYPDMFEEGKKLHTLTWK